MRKFFLVLFTLCLFGAVRWYQQRPQAHPAGVLVGDEPVQVEPSERTPIERGDFELRPLADFSVRARVLSRHDYRFGVESALSPTDFALGWGRMSDTAVIAQLDIAQSARFYTYRWTGAPPIPREEIVRSSSNMHLIPADDAVAADIARVRTGEVVELQGRLVEARRADGWRWTSSLRRDDSGAGACELVLVDAISVVP